MPGPRFQPAASVRGFMVRWTSIVFLDVMIKMRKIVVAVLEIFESEYHLTADWMCFQG